MSEDECPVGAKPCFPDDLLRYLQDSREALTSLDLDKARKNAERAIALGCGISDPYYLLAAICRNQQVDHKELLEEAGKLPDTAGVFTRSDFGSLEFFATSFTTKRTWGISTTGVRISFDGGPELEVLNKQHITAYLMKGRHKVKMKVMGEVQTDNTSTLDVDSEENYLVSYMSIKCIPYLKKTR